MNVPTDFLSHENCHWLLFAKLRHSLIREADHSQKKCQFYLDFEAFMLYSMLRTRREL